MRGRDLVGSTRAEGPSCLACEVKGVWRLLLSWDPHRHLRTGIYLGLFPYWAAMASRSCLGLGGRGHSADGGFILRHVAWLSQVKTRPEACPARTYSSTAQTGVWNFYLIAPAWGAAATCDMMAGGTRAAAPAAAEDDGGRRQRRTAGGTTDHSLI